MRIERSQLPGATLAFLFITVFFSVFLQQMAAALGWVSAVAWRRTGGKNEAAQWRLVPVGLMFPLGLFLLASGLSALFSVAPGTGLRIIGKELLAMGLAVAGIGVFRVAQAKLVANIFLGGAAVAAGWSIYQFVFEFGGVIDFGHRAHGFWHPFAFVSYGIVLAMAFALALGLGFWGAGRARAGALVSGALAVIGMVMSYTRASWLVSVALVTVVSLWRRAVVPLMAIVALAGAVLLLLPATDDSRQFAARTRSSFDPAASANVDRLVRYRIGAAVIRDYPLLGVGPGALKVVYPKYALPGAMDNWHLHNVYLQLLAERGPLGLGAWLLAMVWGIVHAFRCASHLESDRRGLAIGIGLLLAAMLLLGVFNYVWEDWRTRSLTLAFLGLAWSPAVTGGESGGRPMKEAAGG